VAGRFETWLAGGKAAAKPQVSVDPAPQRRPGERYDLPATGVGAVAGLGRRLLGFVIDCVVAALITSPFVHVHLASPGATQSASYWSLLTWFVITVIGTGFFGMTPGMVLVGIRVAPLDGRAMLGPWSAVIRAILVMLIVPAVIWDVDRRGLHDRAAGTIVLAAR
jgi:uncharacterized RDD family membrane protein YckC